MRQNNLPIRDITPEGDNSPKAALELHTELMEINQSTPAPDDEVADVDIETLQEIKVAVAQQGKNAPPERDDEPIETVASLKAEIARLNQTIKDMTPTTMTNLPYQVELIDLTISAETLEAKFNSRHADGMTLDQWRDRTDGKAFLVWKLIAPHVQPQTIQGEQVVWTEAQRNLAEVAAQRREQIDLDLQQAFHDGFNLIKPRISTRPLPGGKPQ